MSAGLEAEIVEAAVWLREQAARTPFGTVTVALTLHAGGVMKVERGIVETRKPGNGGSYGQRGGS